MNLQTYTKCYRNGIKTVIPFKKSQKSPAAGGFASRAVRPLLRRKKILAVVQAPSSIAKSWLRANNRMSYC